MVISYLEEPVPGFAELAVPLVGPGLCGQRAGSGCEEDGVVVDFVCSRRCLSCSGCMSPPGRYSMMLEFGFILCRCVLAHDQSNHVSTWKVLHGEMQILVILKRIVKLHYVSTINFCKKGFFQL